MPIACRSSRRRVAIIITGGLFVSLLLSLPYLSSPYPMPGRTAANMIRVQFLYAAWSMTVMALVAVSVWDALALDSRDTEILGPLPLARGAILRAKVSALIMFSAGFAAALNVVPAMIHPVSAVSSLRPSVLQVARSSRLTSPARRLPRLSGSSRCSGCASYCMPSWEPPCSDGFRWLYERGS